MKKLLYFSAALLATLVACNKGGSNAPTPEQNQEGNIPAWVQDESLPVPILFNAGNGAETKAGLIENADFIDADFRYGVTAMDIGTGTKLFPTAYFNAVAKNTNSGALAANHYLAKFVSGDEDVTYYYPFKSDNVFTFFGYRTNDDDDFDLTWDGSGSATTATVKNIAIGHQDVLWARAAAPALTPEPGENITGFNAKYVRKAWEYVNNVPAAFYSTWAPKLVFNHVTTAFQFVIKTDQGRNGDPDGSAKKFENTGTYVTGLTVHGLHNKADLLVTATGLTDEDLLTIPENTATADIAIDGNTVDFPTVTRQLYYQTDPTDYLADPTGVEEPQASEVYTEWPIYYQSNPADYLADPTHVAQPARGTAVTNWPKTVTRALTKFYPQYNGGEGNDYGDPLLVLPSAVEEDAGITASPTATLTLHVPNQTTDESITLTLTKPSGGFLAGKKYVFTILIHSPEEIEVVTTLEDWDTNTDPISLEIE